MNLLSIRTGCAALVASCAAAGCVVLPVQVYIADETSGTPVYESCSLTPELPAGVKVERAGLVAIVSIAHQQGVDVVRVQFDIPEGSTVVLREQVIKVDARDGSAPREAPIPHINPAAPARFPETPAIEKLVLPADAPLRGAHLRAGTLTFDKHYWVAAPVDGGLAPEIWVSLPEIAVNGTPVRFPDVHFARRLAIGRGLFNC